MLRLGKMDALVAMLDELEARIAEARSGERPIDLRELEELYTTGCAQVLKPRLKHLRIVAVEHEDSAILSGGKPGPHKSHGIGAGFVPRILDPELIDETLPIGNETAFATSSGKSGFCGMIPGTRVFCCGCVVVVTVPAGAARCSKANLPV